MEGEDNKKRWQNQWWESKQTLGPLGKKKKWAEGFQNYQISQFCT